MARIVCRPFVVVFLVAVSSGCGTVETVHAGELRLTPGAEESPWELAPKPRRARLYSITADGTREQGAEVEVPIERLRVNRDVVSAYAFDAFDDDGLRVVGARSLPIDSEALAESSLPLFYSRARAFARPPGEFPDSPGGAPVHALLQGRYWVTVLPHDNESMMLLGYDLLGWTIDGDELRLRCPSPPCVPSAAACSAWTLLVLGGSWGIWVDLETGSSGDVSLPDGLDSFAELSGARTVNGPGDRAFIVGPSRSAEAADAVLVLEPDRTLTLLRTRTPRRAASTTWAEGLGLLVVGGSDVAPALEFLGEEDDEFVELPYPPFPVFAGQAAVDESTVVSLGGLDEDGAPSTAASFDLRCDEDCEAVRLPTAIGIRGGVAAPSGPSTYTVIGAGSEGAMAGAVVDTASASVLAIRVPRSRHNAGYSVLPTAHLGVIGGETTANATARSIELVLP